MSAADTGEARKPRLFSPDDPALLEEAVPGVYPFHTAPPPSDAGRLTRPTLADLGQRGLRWGTMLVSALAGAACLGAAAWFYRLISAALEREDWVGWTTFALMLTAAFAAAMLVLRELAGFLRLSRLKRLRTDVAVAITDRDQKRERRAARQLSSLYAGRPELAWGISRFRDHARDVHDAGELLALAERELLVPLDAEARRLITRSAKRVATVTALSPMVLVSLVYVLIENLRLLRTLGACYGARPGFFGAVRLAHMVFTHLVATGGLAMTDDLLGQFLGQDVLRRLSRRLGEGAFNGALTARIGVAGIHVVRPLPFQIAKPPRVRDVLGEALKPIFAGKQPNPAGPPA
jgi:putative membrane protein